MAAKTVLLSGKKKDEDGRILEKVTSSYRRWHDRLVLAVQFAMPSDCPYTVIHTESLVRLFTCIFAKNTEKVVMKGITVASMKRGMGWTAWKQACIMYRPAIDETSVCVTNCRLAAGQHRVQQRKCQRRGMFEEKMSSHLLACSRTPSMITYVVGDDGSCYSIMRSSSLTVTRATALIDVASYSSLPITRASGKPYSCTTKEMRFNRGFRFRTFSEGPFTFAPTHKYDRGLDEFDSSEKRRVPAWCDRVLWRSRVPERLVQTHYCRWEPNISDHRPISAGFVITIKSADGDKRRRARREVEKMWDARQVELLHQTRDWYSLQAMIV